MVMWSATIICLSCQAAALSIAPTPLPRCAIATRCAAVSMASATSTDDATAAFAAEAKRAAEAELDTPTIAELVEASFVRAVMDLRTGLVDTLKLFVAAVKAGYERSVPLPEMEASLDAVERQTAGRPLLDEEVRAAQFWRNILRNYSETPPSPQVELRSAWLSLVYLTLERRGVASTSNAGASIPPRVREVYESAVDTILLKREIASVEFKDLKLRELLPGDEAKARNPIERAILSQSLKLMYAVQNSQFAGEFAILRRNFAAQFSDRLSHQSIITLQLGDARGARAGGGGERAGDRRRASRGAATLHSGNDGREGVGPDS